MNNETIASIIGFGIGASTIAVFAIITIILLLKRRHPNEKLLTEYCLGDVIKTKRMLESANSKPEDCKIIRPRKFQYLAETRMFSSTLGEDTAKYLFGIETLYKASPKTTESIIEYINTAKQFVRSAKFAYLTTPEKRYVAARIEEQLCMIIFKYIDGVGYGTLNKDDESTILSAIGLEHLLMISDIHM